MSSVDKGVDASESQESPKFFQPGANGYDSLSTRSSNWPWSNPAVSKIALQHVGRGQQGNSAWDRTCFVQTNNARSSMNRRRSFAQPSNSEKLTRLIVWSKSPQRQRSINFLHQCGSAGWSLPSVCRSWTQPWPRFTESNSVGTRNWTAFTGLHFGHPLPRSIKNFVNDDRGTPGGGGSWLAL